MLYERALFQTHWQNISLMEISKQKKIDPSMVAASDFYEAFYKRLEKSSYNFDDNWVQHRRSQTNRMRHFAKEKLAENQHARFLSLGAGTGFIEEPLLKEDISIDLQECQDVSFNYLKGKEIVFNEIITSDLSSLPREKYDIIFAFGIAYCFSYDEYISFLRSIYRALKTGGELILWDSCIDTPRKSLRNYLISSYEKGKQFIKNYQGAPTVPKAVFWGWLRHSYLHLVLAKKVGFSLKEIIFTDHYCNPVTNQYAADMVLIQVQK
jgi:cyclopropane fatty-acyl-phospholipid synthase-like methyltransferase